MVVVVGAVEKHIEYLVTRGASPHTIRARRAVLARLGSFAGVEPEDATATHVEAFIAARRRGHLGRRPLSDGSLRAEIAHVRGFYVWAGRFDVRGDDPSRRLDSPRPPSSSTRATPDAVIADALAASSPVTAAAVSLGAFAGLRCAEIAGLDWSDVDMDAGTILVRHGKGRRSRVVPVVPPIREALLRLPDRVGPVVVSKDGAALTANAVGKRVGRILSTTSAHALRHRWATVAYRRTRDIRAVQDGLGHASPATTARYARPGDDALRSASEAAARLE